jgi:hypothetical protein
MGAPAIWQQRLEMTSLTFMLNWLPLPVIHTCNGKHVVVLAGEDFVAGLDDQFISPTVEPVVGMIGSGSGFFQRCVRSDHLARDEILADAEMLQRALRLRPPQFIRGYLDLA